MELVTWREKSRNKRVSMTWREGGKRDRDRDSDRREGGRRERQREGERGREEEGREGYIDR